MWRWPESRSGDFVIPYGDLRVFVALIPDKYPRDVLTFSDPPPSDGGRLTDDIADLCAYIEVLTTTSSQASGCSKGATAAASAVAAGAGQSNPLRDVVQNLRTPIALGAYPAVATVELEEAASACLPGPPSLPPRSASTTLPTASLWLVSS